MGSTFANYLNKNVTGFAGGSSVQNYIVICAANQVDMRLSGTFHLARAIGTSGVAISKIQVLAMTRNANNSDSALGIAYNIESDTSESAYPGIVGKYVTLTYNSVSYFAIKLVATTGSDLWGSNAQHCNFVGVAHNVDLFALNSSSHTITSVSELTGREGTKTFFNSRIGISQSNPLHKLHVFDGSTTNSAVLFDSSINSSSLSGNTANNGYGHALCLENSQGTVGNIVSLGLQVRTGGSWSNAAITTKAINTSGNAQMCFWTESSNTIGERLRIEPTGEIKQYGFTGTSDPAADDLVIGNTSGGVNRGMTIWSHSSQNGCLAFADNDANFRGAVQYLHNGDDLRFLASNLERYRITPYATYVTPTTGGDSVNTKQGGRFYTLSGSTPLDGTYNSDTETPLMRCGHSFNGTMKIWMIFAGDEYHNGCRQMTVDCQGTYGYIDFEEESFFHTNALGAGLNSLTFAYQNSGSPNYYFKVRGTWANGQNTPIIHWSWTGHNSEYPYPL